MARDTQNAELITSTRQLVEYMAGGEKPREAWRLGTEHEKFGFHMADHTPVAYDGPRGIERLLRGMEGLLGWEPILDGEAIIGLADPVGGGAISLEPGGQFELSGAPLRTLHHTCREMHAHLAQVREIARPLGIGFLGLGMSPKWTRAETPVMPKSRYKIMSAYMPKVGTRGLDMMFRTCTVQVNLDFGSEADMAAKMRASIALQPIATALFAASPFTEGKPNGFLSYRSEIWRDTDNQRSGMVPFVFEPGFGYERYVEWALDVPMYFVKRGATYHDATHVTFRQFMTGATKARWPDIEPNLGDFINHLGTLFPEVRLKRYLEMRGADAGPTRRLLALPAFWVGLLYDQGILDQVVELTKDWTNEERQALRDRVPRHGLKTSFRGGNVLDVARQVVALSREGLRRRAEIDSLSNGDESHYLAPLDEILATGETFAERLLALYHGPWGGRIDPVFDEFAY